MYNLCMGAKNKLNAEDREFFYLVAKAAFGNPLDTKTAVITREFAKAKNEIGERLQKMAIASVRERLRIIKEKGKDNLQLYVDDDRKLIRIALLYDVFHRFINDFDALIVKQIQTGNESCSVPFADKTLTLLKAKGFSEDEACQYFAFFYQMRRAWYFIYHSLIGESPCMEKLRCHLWNNIFTCNSHWYEKFLWDRMEDFSTFIVGETGTGKGRAAVAIGRSGFIPFIEKKGRFAESFTRSFVEINLSQFPESLIESELFGHEKGAFTGAVESHEGIFARSSPHGAIFLDEIGDVSIPVQIKLLKVLQERNFSAVGSHKKQRFHGRVIAATNKQLAELRQQGKFRDDFYYRLCSDVIPVPSLRQQIKEHPGTLDALLNYIIQQITGEHAPHLLQSVKNILNKEISPDYPWPGNVRELEQATRRILLTQHYSGDQRNGFPDPKNYLFKGIEDGNINAQELLTSYCALLYKRHGTYEEVSRITKLDRRTVKKYIIRNQETAG